jgi:hypothetical protein
VIDEWLLADRDAPPKQRHTAKRIWRRLVDEHGADVAEVTVRQYVRARKRELGWLVGEVFVPQVHAPGVEAEVEWGEALVVLGGVSVKVHLFVMRASFSGAAFCQASLVGLSRRSSSCTCRRSSGSAACSRSSGRNMCPGTYSNFCAQLGYVAARVTRLVITAVGGGGVPERVRADPPAGSRVVELGGVAADDLVDPVAGERLSAGGEHRGRRRR